MWSGTRVAAATWCSKEQGTDTPVEKKQRSKKKHIVSNSSYDTTWSSTRVAAATWCSGEQRTDTPVEKKQRSK
jgi:hypothetical protein